MSSHLSSIGLSVAIAVVVAIALPVPGSTDAVGQASAQVPAQRQASTMRIRMAAAGQVIDATLADNETARDLPRFSR